MFSIGEFSKLTGLTVKTLRYYHEQDLLAPTRVDTGTGYRSYDESKIETARCIVALRDLGFSIADTKAILADHDQDSTLIDFLQSRKKAIQDRIDSDRKTLQLLDSIIAVESAAGERSTANAFEVTEDQVQPILIASLRHQGAYEECGKQFGRIGRRFGRHLCGRAMLLCYDEDYREEADFAVAFPIRKGKSIGEIQVHELPGGKSLSLMHRGPYATIRRSYSKLLRAAKRAGVSYDLPTHEIYHKGPGMLLRGNPEKYLTEIRLMISEVAP